MDIQMVCLNSSVDVNIINQLVPTGQKGYLMIDDNA